MSARKRTRAASGLASLTTLEKLLQVGQSLILVRDLESLLQQIVEAAGAVLGADVIVLYEYHEEAGDVTIPPVIWGEIEHPEVPRERSRARPHTQSAVFQMLERTEPFYAPDAGPDWATLIPDWQAENSFIHREGIASSAAVPLIADGQRVGALFVNYRTRHTFPDEERRTIELFATQAAIAIQNARLLQRERAMREQTQALRDVSHALKSAVDLREVGGDILDELAQVIEYRKASAQLIRGDIRTLIAYRGYGEGTIDKWLLRPVSQDRLVNRIVERKEPLILSDPPQSKYWGVRPGTKDVLSWAGIPLIYEQEVIGLLTLDHNQPGFYTDAQREILTAFAERAAVEIHNASLYDIARRRARDLEIINQVVQIINTQLEPQDILRTVVAQIASRLDCAYAAFIPQETGQEREDGLHIPPIIRDARREPLAELPSNLGRDVACWALKRQTAVLVSGPEDDRFSSLWGERESARSLLAAPVTIGDDVIGAIVADQNEFGWFGESDLRLVDGLARQASAAIERAVGLALLQDISNRIISAPQVQITEIMRRIVAGAIQLTDATTGVIYLLNEDGSAIAEQFEYPVGFDHPAPRMSAGGITTQIVDSGQVMKFPDIRQDSRVNPEMHIRVRSMIGVPLKIEQKVIGVLYLNHKEQHDFADIEVSQLSTLASQAAIAIRNAQLFKEARQRTEELTLLHEVSAQLMTLDREQLLTLIIRGAMRLTATESGVIYLLNEDGTRILDPVVYPPDAVYPQADPSPTGLTHHIFETGEPVFITDTGQDARVNPDIVAQGIQAFIGQPLQDADRVIGVLYLNDTEQRQFSPSERSLVSTLADQAAVAIYNARLFETRQRLDTQLENLHRIVQEQNLDQVLERIVEGISAILGAAISPTINLYRQATDSFGRCHACGPLKDELESEQPRMGGTGRHVIQAGEPLYLEDVRNPPPGSPTIRPESIAMGIQSFAALPLRRQDQTVGVLFINAQRPLAFPEETRRVLELFAGQAAIAIHISQDLERKIRELEVLTEIGRTVSSLGIDQILVQIHDQAARLMDARNLYIAFYDESTDTVRFPLAYSDGERIETGIGAWKPRRRAEPLAEGQTRSPNEPRYGLTEYVIDNREAEVSLGDMWEWAKERRIELSPKIPTKSWIGAPLRIWDRDEGVERVIGVISIQSYEQENVYDENDRQILETIANQSAVAIQNARLYAEQSETIRQLEEAQDKIRQLERVRTISNMAADFVHRINNMAGTIPIRVQRIRETLEAEYPQARPALTPFLKGIMDDTQELLTASQRLQESTRERPEPQLINVHSLVGTIVREIRLQTPASIQIHDEALAPELPPVLGIEAELAEAIRDVTKNAVEAMAAQGGRLDIATSCHRDEASRQWVEIEIRDQGPGIPEDLLPKLCDLFYTTKEGGLGYGLWRTRNTVEAIGGEIEIESQVGHGTTVYIRLPAAEPAAELAAET